MWLGLDDTDSLDGGCTTLVFHQLLKELPCEHGEPRLTRLWPFASRRTRGNASLSVELYCEESIEDWLDLYWKEHILPLKGKVAKSNHSKRTQYPSDPGMVLFDKQPNEEYYWSAVRGEVDFYEGGKQWGGMGRIGAAASCAWRESNATWEGIAWRENERNVSVESLRIVDSMEGTFLCRDPRSKRGLISPRGPCPVMFCVRGNSREVTKKATEILLMDCSPTIGSRVYKTNQGSGDHLDGTVTDSVREIKRMKGGHVIINNKFLMFSDSGDVNQVAQWLQTHDEFEVKGLEYKNQIHVEAIRILSSTQKMRPLCECGTRMKSMGTNQGVKCPNCKKKSDNAWIKTPRNPLWEGWVLPPVDKRRHLAKW